MKIRVREWHVMGHDKVITGTEVVGWLTRFFRTPEEQTWRGEGTVWHDHVTGQRANTWTESELSRLETLIDWGRLDGLKKVPGWKRPKVEA